MIFRALILLFVIVMGSAPGQAQKPLDPETILLTKMVRSLQEGYQGYQLLGRICTMFAHRMSGSDEGAAAEEYLVRHLATLGVKVERQPFPIQVWERGNSLVQISYQGKKVPLAARSLAFTPLQVESRGEVFDIGTGYREDFIRHAASLKDKVVLVDIYPDIAKPNVMNPHRSDKLRWAQDAQARGVLFVNRYPGELLPTGTVSRIDSLVAIPAFILSRGAGLNLRALVRNNRVVAHLRASARMRQSQASNILVHFPARRPSNETVVIGAHFDTWDLAPGAIDNGIGALALFDIIRVWTELRPLQTRNITFAFWMGEEQGQIGSSHFIKQMIHQGKADSLKFYINVDMVANTNGFDMEGREELSGYLSELGKRIQSLGLDFENKQQNKISLATDTIPFFMQGVPVVQTMGQLPPLAYRAYHTSQDQFFLVQKKHMILSSQVLAILLHDLAVMDQLPAARFSDQQIKAWLRKHQAEELLNYPYGR